MTRILILTHYFAPEVGAPQTRLLALAGHLHARGSVVTVHAPPPHYPNGVVRSPYRNHPHGCRAASG
jgi:colanic acid biosynthesis glycosyl transferase WcaI